MKVDKNKDLNNWPFNKYNYILFFTGLFIILIGYLIMKLGAVDSFQSVRLAPFFLIVGYLILIPLSIFFKK